MSTNKGCGKPWVAYSGNQLRGHPTAVANAAEIHHVKRGFNNGSVRAMQKCGSVMDSRSHNHVESEIGNARHWTSSQSTPIAWGQPNQAQRLGLQCTNPPSVLQDEANAKTFENSTVKAWGQPNQAQRLGLQCTNTPPVLQSEANVKVLENSTAKAWAQPDRAHRSGLQEDTRVKTAVDDDDEDTEEDEDDIFSDDDDDLLSDDDFDSDGFQEGCKISWHHKLLCGFFKMLDRLTVEEINDPSRQYHCPVCQGGPGAIDWYRGLQPVMLHAKTKGSKRVKLHRKFADLLIVELEKRGVYLTLPSEAFGQWEGPQPNVKDVEIVWPPMVIVMNTFLEKDFNDKWIGMGNEELLLNFGSYGALKARHSYGPQGHRGMSALLFENSAKGYTEAQRLDGHFQKQGRGRTAWDRSPVLFGPGGKRRLFGFMALKKDLDLFNRHSGKSKLKFDMRSYEEMVAKRIAQMSEDNELLIWYQKRAARAEQLAKATEESLRITSLKWLRTFEDSKNVNERSKMQIRENQEQMEYLEQFVEERFRKFHDMPVPTAIVSKKLEEETEKENVQSLNSDSSSMENPIHEMAVPVASDTEKSVEKSGKENVELVNSKISSMLNPRDRVDERINTLELTIKDEQSFDAERLKLIDAFQDKMNELERRYQEAKLEAEREFDAELAKLIDRHTTLC